MLFPPYPHCVGEKGVSFNLPGTGGRLPVYVNLVGSYVGPRLSAQVGEGTKMSLQTPIGPGSGSNGIVINDIGESVGQAGSPREQG